MHPHPHIQTHLSETVEEVSSISTLLKWLSVVVAVLLLDVAVTEDVR